VIVNFHRTVGTLCSTRRQSSFGRPGWHELLCFIRHRGVMSTEQGSAVPEHLHTVTPRWWFARGSGRSASTERAFAAEEVGERFTDASDEVIHAEASPVPR
jgi:hypothetical protein